MPVYLAFQNNDNRHVWVATLRFDPDGCGGEGRDWRSQGWWSLAPGESKTAIWTTNQYVFFYAESDDGSWWGDSAGPGVYVNNDRFEDCFGIGHSTWRIVNMSEVNVGWPPARPFTHTVNLNP